MPRPPASLRTGATPPDAPPAGKPEATVRESAPATPAVRGSRRVQEARQALRAIQPQLFNINSKGDLIQTAPIEFPALKSDSMLEVALLWFKSHLESLNRPRNTIASYMYDLTGFEEQLAEKRLDKVSASDVAGFLAQSQKKSTRKRRLTSLGAFFKYLIQTEKVLERDPTDNFFSDFVPLKTPVTLDHEEQAALLNAARRENSRTYLMIYMMLKLGLTRTELLAIQPEHIDISDPAFPQVYVAYDDKRWHKKERKLAAAAEFTPAFQSYMAEFQPARKLFEMLPQSVNKLVERVARDAEINKKVTPQSIRDTYAVEEARGGATATDLLKIMGLAPDPRNRMSVDRYIKIASS